MFPNILYWGHDTGQDAPLGGTVCVLIETAGEFQGDPLTLGDTVVEDYFNRLEQLPLYQALVEGGLDAAGLTGRGRTAERDDDTWTVPQQWLHDEVLGDIRPTVYRSTPEGDVWRIITPEGGIKDEDHNDYHQVTRTVNSAGATTSFTYNEDGLMVSKELPNGTRSSIEPGKWGTPVRSIDTDGSVTEFCLDAFGLVESVTSSSGAVTEYRYDVRASGIVPQATRHADGTVTEVECDDAGRTLAVIDHAGRRSSMLRDVRGLVVESIDPVGAVTTVRYTPEGWPAVVENPDGTSVSIEYDSEGNRVAHTNEIGATGTVKYTVFDKPSMSIDFCGATTRLEYNTQMQPIVLLNSDGNRWSYTYDLDGMLAGELDYNGISSSATVSPDGLLATVTTPAGTTSQLRHADGRTKSITDASGVTKFIYDEFDRLTRISGPSATIDYIRDEFGRTTAERITLLSGETTEHSVELDRIGNILSESIALPLGDTFSSRFMRDGEGEIIRSEHSRISLGSEVSESIADIEYGVDERGRRNHMRTGSLIQDLLTDDRGRTTAVSLLAFDSSSAGGMRTVSSRMFEWREDGALKSVADYLRGITTFDLDLAGRVTRLTRTNRSADPKAPLTTGQLSLGETTEEAYGFSSAGVLNFIDAKEHSPSTALGTNRGPSQKKTINQAALSGVDSRVEFDGTMPTRVGRTTYTYDKAGRVTQTVTKRISKKPLVHKFFYASGEQPIGFTTSDEPGVGYRYFYDPRGRRVAKERVDIETGELLTRTVYVHAGEQLVAEQITFSAADETLISEHSLVNREASDESLCHDLGSGYVWITDPATVQVVGQIKLRGHQRDGSTTPGETIADFVFVMTDLAGSPQELVSPVDGTVVAYAEQTLYGKRTWCGAESSPLLYAGQYLDAESGWAYNRCRYYDPHAGIYNAQDPLGVSPHLASAQGYVGHAAHWVDVFGLKAHQVTAQDLRNAGVKPEKIDETMEFLNRNPSGNDYHLYSYGHENGPGMKYVGQSVDTDRRALEHGDKFKTKMEVADIDPGQLNDGADAFTRYQARAFEEAKISEIGFDKFGNSDTLLHNRRHEIATSRSVHEGAVQWANWMMDKGALKFAH
ncbi:RHS repeat-associated core domain-containing protein [Corynebacterium sp. MSK044]|uniref:RHS repeat-associated core domain-containing protein n=1 Tax=Corynebacterium sp. MSK044 TaxID=3050195 RepID=UPI00254D2C3B|nr:RHS repeat-associated core domain-containing protein [Corynebacterium sp. MSK044]MDK8798301.1 RHS repeat-associated core domain-containing protein [Corynebacterium sp. MSK044]